MKKSALLWLAMAMFSIGQANAQFGIQAGPVGILGEAFPTADGLDKLGGALGFTAGLLYNYPLNEKINLQPALNFVKKSWRDELENLSTGDLEKTSVNINYLEIPVQLVFHGGNEKGFFVGIGPSFNFGLSGKRKVEFNGSSTTSDYAFGSGVGEEAPFTLAINAMVGYSFGNFNINLNFNQGLTNQPSDNQDQGNVNHLALRLAYLFGTGN
ncbi:porin family protein [Pararhodonellum marinum]|uniref:porin family protein n=1 Tax=Pararhodonellum marinum TaxID=2755358 RepID=UPI00188DCFB3|nr:porin family protein [Pararhodonellum marinum]